MPANTTAYDFAGLSIGGHWRAGRSEHLITDRDPYSGETLLEIAGASVEDVEEAFQVAASSQRDWASATPSERAEVLRKAATILDRRKDEVVDWLIKESGSVRVKAELEWGAARAIILEASTMANRAWGRILPGDIPGKEHRIYRKPVGVVTVISPWNWPLHLSSRAVAPALALGNAVLLKPAAETLVTGGLLLGRIFEEAGLPAGVLNVVAGDDKIIGDPIVLNPLSRVISFTGSTPVGRRIAGLAATGPVLKRAQLELGGNNPLVVLDDADLDQAVRIAVFGRFLHQGELCVSANRLIVDAAIADRFEEAFVEAVRALRYGDPSDPKTAIGPIINQRQFDRLQAMIAEAQEDGARALLTGRAEGLVLPPHVFATGDRAMRLGQQEIFGPITPIIRARNDDEALKLANDTEYGLSSAVLTRDLARGERFAHNIEAGMTHINDLPAVDLANMPFGGEKNSGIGRFGAEGVVADFTTEHWISVQTTPRAYPF